MMAGMRHPNRGTPVQEEVSQAPFVNLRTKKENPCRIYGVPAQPR